MSELYMVVHLLKGQLKQNVEELRCLVGDEFNEFGAINMRNSPHLTIVPPFNLKVDEVKAFFRSYKVNKKWCYRNGQYKHFNEKVVFIEIIPSRDLLNFLQQVQFKCPIQLKSIILHATIARRINTECKKIMGFLPAVDENKYSFDNIYLMKLKDREWVICERLI